MTEEQIYAMAESIVGDYSDQDFWPFFKEELLEFALKVASSEREACAKIVEASVPFGRIDATAAAIRARGNE